MLNHSVQPYYCLSSRFCFPEKNQLITFTCRRTDYFTIFCSKTCRSVSLYPQNTASVWVLSNFTSVFRLCEISHRLFCENSLRYCVHFSMNFRWYFASSQIRFFDFSMPSRKFCAILRIFADFREISNVKCAKFQAKLRWIFKEFWWEQSTNFVEIHSHYFCTVL